MNTEPKITATLQKYYDKVFQDGKLVNVHIGMWGMSVNLTEEDILLDNKLPDTIDLGKKMLIQKAVYKKFKNIEGKIRRYLYTNSFEFPLISQAHFVPKNRYLEVYTELNKLKNEYMATAEEFIQNYDKYKQEALEFYEQHKDSVKIDALERYYPSKESMRAKFYVHIVSFEIALPTEFKELNLQDEIQRELFTEEAKQKALADYQHKYNQQLETHMGKIGEFMTDVTTTLRSKVAEFCATALKKINDKEVVSAASIKSILKNIQEVRRMNFTDDAVVEEQLRNLEQIAGSDRDFSKDTDSILLLQGCLNSAITQVSKVTDVATVSGEYFRKMSV